MVIHGTTAIHITDKVFSETHNIVSHTLEAWLTSEAYNQAIERSIVIAPLITSQNHCYHRLGPDGQILYSSLDNINTTELGAIFEQIESHFKINLVYGTQSYIHPVTQIVHQVETLLIDVQHMSRSQVNQCKRDLFEEFGIQSHCFEHLWAYEQCIRLAPAALAVLQAMGTLNEMTTLISHDTVGVPTLLYAMLNPSCHATTAFCAHEVHSARQIIENHPGHDTMFYNVMDRAQEEHLHINDVFGELCHTYQHVLTKAACHCHRILATGHQIAKEIRFLAPEFETKSIDIVYQGLSTKPVNLATVRDSKAKLQTYCDTLLGFKPDWIFSHVAKRIKSKALWRDVRILSALDREFQQTGQTGVMLMLCTETAPKPARDIKHMEANYGWPVAHREGMPDLIGEEIPFFSAVQTFNARARNIKILFINQYRFDARTCGNRMVPDMIQADLVQGTDVEFCQSIYEPFGSTPLESAAYGAICVMSHTCGCIPMLENLAHGIPTNIIFGNYTDVGQSCPDIEDTLQINQSRRDQIEQTLSRSIAQTILDKLPQNDVQAQILLDIGSSMAEQLNWESTIRNYVYPALQNSLVYANK